jgi:hypothetical protein
MSAMGSCIKVVLKKIGFLPEKNVVSSRLFCHGYSQNYKLTPAIFLLAYVRIIKLGLNNKLLKGREGGEGGSSKKSSKKLL